MSTQREQEEILKEYCNSRYNDPGSAKCSEWTFQELLLEVLVDIRDALTSISNYGIDTHKRVG